MWGYLVEVLYAFGGSYECEMDELERDLPYSPEAPHKGLGRIGIGSNMPKKVSPRIGTGESGQTLLITYLRSFKFIFLHKKMLFILFILFRGHRKPVFMRFV